MVNFCYSETMKNTFTLNVVCRKETIKHILSSACNKELQTKYSDPTWDFLTLFLTSLDKARDMKLMAAHLTALSTIYGLEINNTQ